MTARVSTVERALFTSLIHGPVLVGDLPEAPVFAHDSLDLPSKAPVLNLDQKLGHLFEDVLATLLEASSRYELVARNLQIQPSRHETLGELDFLIRDRERSELIHLELATKFYLGVETEDGLQLPGPDSRDNYFRKLRHLRENQVTLCSRHRDLLPAAYAAETLVTRQLVYGCIFDHIGARQRAAPAFLHSSCRRGHWLTLDELDHFAPGARLERIPKHLWPVPLEILADLPLLVWEPPELLKYCTMLRVDGCPEPCFVVPSSYPGHTDRCLASRRHRCGGLDG